MASKRSGDATASLGGRCMNAIAEPNSNIRKRTSKVEDNSKQTSNVLVRGEDGYAYRRSVQVFFMNERSEFLLCLPVGKGNENFCQTVQGGSEAGESPRQTAQRETWEEIGLLLEKEATFLCEVLPSNTVGEVCEVRNDKNEITSELRKAFRYSSKTWRKLGIWGQELYPLLYFLHSSSITRVNTNGRRRGVRDEFRSVQWGSLTDLFDRAPPAKKAVMSSVCRAVAAAAKPFVESQGYPITGLTVLYSPGS